MSKNFSKGKRIFDKQLISDAVEIIKAINRFGFKEDLKKMREITVLCPKKYIFAFQSEQPPYL